MKPFHVPRVNTRYWAGITLASVFGTNLGDLYAHTSGLGLIPGVWILCLFAFLVFMVERLDSLPHELYYWLLIIIIRTGATNIADYLAFRIKVPPVALTLALAALLALLAWASWRLWNSAASEEKAPSLATLPGTNATYWFAMLAAGVLGTVLGDICAHAFGKGFAAIGLSLILGLAFLGWYKSASGVAIYWLTVAVARTAGTAIGDWLAENKITNIGLPISTLLTGLVFVAVLSCWPRLPVHLMDKKITK
jgi:uncharacterized membrane-anchored protein